MRPLPLAALSIVLLSACGSPSGSDPQARRSPCESTTFYRVESIDERSRLSMTEALEALEKAAAVWNAERKKPLFAHASDGALKVRFLLDERHALDEEAATLREQVDLARGQLQPEMERWKEELARFEARREAFQAERSAWEAGPRTDAAAVEDLNRRARALNEEAAQLNARGKELQGNVDAANARVAMLNDAAGRMNAAIKDRPEQGLWKPDENAIEVYFVARPAERVHTLAHELGHSIGLGHTEGRGGIMARWTTEALELSADDRRLLSELCSRR